jgi:hypothetical protein
VGVIDTLFVTEDTGTSSYCDIEGNGGGTPRSGDAVQMEDLREAVGCLNVKKAVGIDGIPGAINKLIHEHRAQDLLAMVNSIYESPSRTVTKDIYAGVPQSSMVDPL